MTTITTTWEIEVEQAHADFDGDHDEARFRERMKRLGFDDGEIDGYLATARRDADAMDDTSRRTGAT